MRDLIIYHGNCFDGMCSAWVLSKTFPEATFVPMNYGEELPTFYPSDNVIFVDFSVDRKTMLNIKDIVNSILVLDHHKTAQKELEGLDFAIFDMEKSGAQLAFEHYPFKGENEPRLVSYVADRDLWKFKLISSEEVNAFIQSFPMTIRDYDYINSRLEYFFPDCVNQGSAIIRYKNESVARMCKQIRFITLMINNDIYPVPIVNASLLFSEVGHELCKQYKDASFSISFFKRADGKVQYSLRSIGDFDVSVIAKAYGGGGHKNAAGFELDHYLA